MPIAIRIVCRQESRMEEWKSRMEWNRMEWNGMAWNGMPRAVAAPAAPGTACGPRSGSPWWRCPCEAGSAASRAPRPRAAGRSRGARQSSATRASPTGTSPACTPRPPRSPPPAPMPMHEVWTHTYTLPNHYAEDTGVVLVLVSLLVLVSGTALHVTLYHVSSWTSCYGYGYTCARERKCHSYTELATGSSEFTIEA